MKGFELRTGIFCDPHIPTSVSGSHRMCEACCDLACPLPSHPLPTPPFPDTFSLLTLFLVTSEREGGRGERVRTEATLYLPKLTTDWLPFRLNSSLFLSSGHKTNTHPHEWTQRGSRDGRTVSLFKLTL